MAVYKRGNVYWYKFVWNGELVRALTRAGCWELRAWATPGTCLFVAERLA